MMYGNIPFIKFQETVFALELFLHRLVFFDETLHNKIQHHNHNPFAMIKTITRNIREPNMVIVIASSSDILSLYRNHFLRKRYSIMNNKYHSRKERNYNYCC